MILYLQRTVSKAMYLAMYYLVEMNDRSERVTKPYYLLVEQYAIKATLRIIRRRVAICARRMNLRQS